MSNSTGAGRLAGKWPAIVKSYAKDRRTCEVSIPGITDGDDALEAEIEYPIGDRPSGENATEIAITKGDMVWIEFIQGDPRYPLITGYRAPGKGAKNGTRRWQHDKIELKTKGEPKGVVQGDCICAYTGQPHVHISETVKAGK